jgi:hypothetical protein
MFRKSSANLDSIDAAVKSNLIERMKECVKELQLKYTAEQWTPLKNEEATSMLCWILEAIFIHGLKNTFIKSLSVFASRRENSIPNPSFWDFVMIFSHRDIIEQIRRLNYVNSDIGRCRAWIRIALNEMSLVSYLENMVRNPSYVRSFYKPAAFLRDTERCDILKNYLVGIVESCKFELVVDNSLLNQWNSGPLSLVGLWVDDNISQGIDVAQNMESKDLQAIPQLGKSRTPEPQFINVLRRQPLLPEEDAFRIIMASKPNAGSSGAQSGASSRRNSDSSQPSRDFAYGLGPSGRPLTVSNPAVYQLGNPEMNITKPSPKPSPPKISDNHLTVTEASFALNASAESSGPEVMIESTCTIVAASEPERNIYETQNREVDSVIKSEESFPPKKLEEASEELSYVDLLKTYNQEQMLGAAIYSGSPQPEPAFGSDDTGLEETTSSSEVKH